MNLFWAKVCTKHDSRVCFFLGSGRLGLFFAAWGFVRSPRLQASKMIFVASDCLKNLHVFDMGSVCWNAHQNSVVVVSARGQQGWIPRGILHRTAGVSCRFPFWLALQGLCAEIAKIARSRENSGFTKLRLFAIRCQIVTGPTPCNLLELLNGFLEDFFVLCGYASPLRKLVLKMACFWKSKTWTLGPLWPLWPKIWQKSSFIELLARVRGMSKWLLLVNC